MFIAAIIEIILGSIFALYDVVLLCISPGSVLKTIFSFTHVWALGGALLIFAGIYRIRYNQSFKKKLSRKVKIILSVAAGIAVIISIVNLIFILTPDVVPVSEDSDYVILLGGGIDKNGRLPKSVEYRVLKTKEYMDLHKNTVCVVTGGTLRFQKYAEGPEIKRRLMAAGIESDRILIEDKALDTIQNFQYSCKMLADYADVSEQEILESRIMVITNAFHLRRALRLTKRMGFKNTKGIAAKIPWYSVPHSYLREICSYIKLNVRILLTGKPKPIVAM